MNTRDTLARGLVAERLRPCAMAQGFHQVVLTSVFANGTFDLQVYMADDHTVAGFFLRPQS